MKSSLAAVVGIVWLVYALTPSACNKNLRRFPRKPQQDHTEAANWINSRQVATAPKEPDAPTAYVSTFTPEQQRVLRVMADSAGWQEIGGRVVRNLEGEAVGRTHWVGMPDWALGFGYGKAEIKEIVEKAIAGKSLGSKQRLLLKSMLQTMAEASAIDCPF